MVEGVQRNNGFISGDAKFAEEAALVFHLVPTLLDFSVAKNDVIIYLFNTRHQQQKQQQQQTPSQIVRIPFADAYKNNPSNVAAIEKGALVPVLHIFNSFYPSRRLPIINRLYPLGITNRADSNNDLHGSLVTVKKKQEKEANSHDMMQPYYCVVLV